MNVHFNVVLAGIGELRDTHFGAAFAMALVYSITKQRFDEDVGVARPGPLQLQPKALLPLTLLFLLLHPLLYHCKPAILGGITLGGQIFGPETISSVDLELAFWTPVS